MTATEELADLWGMPSDLNKGNESKAQLDKDKVERAATAKKNSKMTEGWYSKQGKKYGIAAGLGASLGGAYGLMKDRDRGRSSLGETSEYGAYGAATGALATGVWSGVQAFRGLK